jgi:hypothetical protein
MKLQFAVGLVMAGIGAAGFVVAGCGSSGGSNNGDGGASSSGGAKDTCDALPAAQCATAEPPNPPSGSMTTVTTPHNYAINKLFLGDSDRMGNTSMTAWASYGYNLDSKVTSAASTDVCTLQTGAMKSIQTDGTNGIDNSFGENLIPLLLMLDGTAPATLNDTLAEGKFTLMTYVVGFDDTPSNMTTATGLTGVLLAGGDYTRVAMGRDGGPPGFDLNTHWPIVPTLLTCGTMGQACPPNTNPITSAVVQFPSAFQTSGLFVTGKPAEVTLNLSVDGHTLSLDIESAVITFDPDTMAPAANTGAVTNGTIAGVLNTTQLLQGLTSILGSIEASLCMGSAAMSILDEIAQDSDILINGSTVSNVSGQTCNAISIGLGFNAAEIALPVAADVEAPSDAGLGNACDSGM